MKIFKKNKRGFTMLELMVALGIFGMIALGVVLISDTQSKQKNSIYLSGYFQQAINEIDRKLQIKVNNSDRILLEGSSSEFCEGLSGWTVDRANEQNLDEEYKLSNEPGDYVMLCDKDGKFNFIGKAIKTLDNGNEHYSFVHYINRRVNNLIPTDNVLKSARDTNSVPSNIKEQVSFITPQNIGIYDMNIEYSYSVPNGSFVKKGKPATRQPSVDFEILFDYGGKNGNGNERNIYRYYRTLNLRTLDFN